MPGRGTREFPLNGGTQNYILIQGAALESKTKSSHIVHSTYCAAPRTGVHVCQTQTPAQTHRALRLPVTNQV
jgi:hypothetical protein